VNYFIESGINMISVNRIALGNIRCAQNAIGSGMFPQVILVFEEDKDNG
jgi:hypothetical protein